METLPAPGCLLPLTAAPPAGDGRPPPPRRAGRPGRLLQLRRSPHRVRGRSCLRGREGDREGERPRVGDRVDGGGGGRRAGWRARVRQTPFCFICIATG